ncbi:MAG: hypothetical protein AAGF54_06055 [Pseudomonadota bacterium]
MAAIGTILSVASTALEVVGTLQEGNQDEAKFNYESKVREQQAHQALASGQRRAQQRYSEGRILQSRQRAVAAAQGDTSDKSVLDILGFSERETQLNARTEIANAQNQSNSLNDAARIARLDGKNAIKNSRLGAIGEAVGGASSIFDRFGQGGFGASKSRKPSPLFGPQVLPA